MSLRLWIARLLIDAEIETLSRESARLVSEIGDGPFHSVDWRRVNMMGRLGAIDGVLSLWGRQPRTVAWEHRSDGCFHPLHAPEAEQLFVEPKP